MRVLRYLTTTAMALALAVITLGAAPQQAAAAEEAYPVPASGYWEVTGRGWGHGIGMSQWGAQGAAQQGLTAAQILGFYYPGTTTNNIGDPLLRVNLSAYAPSRTVTVWNPPGDDVTALGAPGDTDTLAGARYTVTLDAGGFTVQRRATVGGPVVKTYRVDGNELVFYTQSGAVVAPERTSTGGSWYRGQLRLVRTGTATFDVVNYVPMQDYLRGVVPREMPASWRPAALQAQAVAARSYAYADLHPNRHFDTCDTTQCQVYGGRATVRSTGTVTSHEAASTDQAIAATAGQVRWYGGSVAFTQFHSTNGGHSRAGSAPYLVARPDPYTGTAANDTRTRWTDRLDVSTVEARCPRDGALERLVVVDRDGNGAMGGRITEARVECTTGNATVTGDFALRFGMYSPWWRPTTPPTPDTAFFLNDAWTTEANHVFSYGRPTDAVLTGDWDGDGVDTVALRRGNVFFFANAHGGGTDRTVVYGRPGDVVLAGDWDGDGTDTLAVRRGSVYHLKNSVSSGDADRVVAYGRPGDAVLTGDWDGDGADTLAVRRGAQYFIANALRPGPADDEVVYGRAGDVVLVGDWDGDSTDTLAVRRGAEYFVKNSLRPGSADLRLVYGRAGDEVLVGDWDGDSTDTLGVRRTG